jgi:DNA-binding GntR family transcriptional regulator
MTIISIQTNTRRPLHEDLVSRLRDLIVEGQLEPAMHVPERALCEQFNVSRTPMREALKALASEGLVVLLPNRGAVVAALGLEDVEHVVKVIDALEGMSADAACERAGDDDLAQLEQMQRDLEAHFEARNLMDYFKLNQAIHLRIVELAGNPVAYALYSSLLSRIRRYRFVGNREGMRWGRACAEHRQILDALRNRDGALLKQLLSSHLRNGWHVSRELVRDELEANARRVVQIRRRPRSA